MRSIRRLILLVGTLFILGLAWSEDLVVRKLSMFASLRKIVWSTCDDTTALKSEVAYLRSLLEVQKDFFASITDVSLIGRTVPVYSSYPFNVRHVLVLGRGKDAGIELGAPAVVQGMLLGKVIEVRERTALLQTIFDPRWETPVRIGSSGIEALLKGGNLPMLTLVTKEAALASGDKVVNADRAFPYALGIGEVDEMIIDPSRPFQEATLFFPYHAQEIHFVVVLPAQL